MFGFCFVNIPNIFHSFTTCSIHKKPLQNTGNGLKETLFFKIFQGACPKLPPPFSCLWADSCLPPPKFLSPYAWTPYSVPMIRSEVSYLKSTTNYQKMDIIIFYLGITCFQCIFIKCNFNTIIFSLFPFTIQVTTINKIIAHDSILNDLAQAQRLH